MGNTGRGGWNKLIEIEHKVIAGIPLLEFVDHTLVDKKIPLVVFYHGWESVKENVLANGYELARRGIRALLPEALYHGERQDDQPFENHYADFFKIIENNVTEFSTLINYYVGAGIADREQVGVTGLSMGGITTCAILTKYEFVKAAVCLMGSPNLVRLGESLIQLSESNGLRLPVDAKTQVEGLRGSDLSLAPEKIAGRNVHFWHGTQDAVVPYQPTYDFYQKISQEAYGKNVSFTTTKDGHKVPYKISVEMADFFQKNLL